MMKVASADTLSIYAALYSVVDDNLRTALPQAELPITRETFLYMAALPQDVVDVSVIDSFTDTLTFVQCAYWGLLGRLPCKEEAAQWTDRFDSSAALHRTLLPSLLGSTEFSGRNITVCNLPAWAHTPLRTYVLRLARGLYNRLPAPWRSVIRRLYQKCKELLKRK